MADPICRWRNATPETICELVQLLPKQEMMESEFKTYMQATDFGKVFFRTAYQFACQTGLYYIDDNNIYHPRFNHTISLEEAKKYLKLWFKKYYVPNPYTKFGFKDIEKPLYVVKTFEEILKNKKIDNDFSKLCNQVFKDTVGELDIFANAINNYSETLKVENNKITLLLGGDSNMEANVDRNDKKAFFENFNTDSTSEISFLAPNTFTPTQIIFYGVPGSGKSYSIKNQLKANGIEPQNTARVVFHPEYTNADFIGQILPTISKGEKSNLIDYRFNAGVFTQILRKAYQNPETNYALIIEEINRGNAAAIFGELFQLLDRLDEDESESYNGVTYTKGWSAYGISNDCINAYIRGAYDEDSAEEKKPSIHFDENSAIRLPANLSLFATMNTSDQNVFSLDNAFKRRWDLSLIPNKFVFDDSDDGENEKQIHQCFAEVEDFSFSWGAFIAAINEKIIAEQSGEDVSSFEDKQIGCWFVKAVKNGDDYVIPKSVFLHKVIEYLWDDVFKLDTSIVFKGDSLSAVIETAEKNPTAIFAEGILDLIQNKASELANLRGKNTSAEQ